MIIKLPNEITKKCEVSGNRYLTPIDYEATKILRRVIEEITVDAELIGGNIINAHNRTNIKKPFQVITETPESYIKYVLNGYVVYVEFNHFWLFDGVMVSAYPIVSNGYKASKYPIYVTVDDDYGIKNLIRLANNPTIINEKMAPIPVKHKNGRPDKENIEYTTRVRPIEVRFYV